MAEVESTAVEQVEEFLQQEQEATAEAVEQAPQPKERTHYSNPVFKQTLSLNTLQAQRVMTRTFGRVSRSLFSIDVILRIIGEQEEMDQVEVSF
jgi:hypothetical protein